MAHKLDNIELTGDELTLIEIALEKYKTACWGTHLDKSNHSLYERGNRCRDLLKKLYMEIDN